MRQCLEDFINETCVPTLSQINGELRQRPPAKPLIHDRPLLEMWKECCFVLNWFDPFQQTETDVVFSKEGKNMETGSRTMPLCATVFLSMRAVNTSGLPEITGARGRVKVHIDKYAASKDGT